MDSDDIHSSTMNTLRVFTIASLLLSFCVDCYFLSEKFSWKIELKVKPKDKTHNIEFFVNIITIVFIIWTVFIIVVEIINMATILVFEEFDISFQKALAILSIGLGHLGMCGDLGFSSGIITLVPGVIWLVIGIMSMAKEVDV